MDGYKSYDEVMDELVPDDQIFQEHIASIQKGAKIVQKGDQWCVESEEGKNLGCSDSREGAEKRLKQVEYFKHKGGSLAARAIAYARSKFAAYKEIAAKFDGWSDEQAKKTWESLGGSEHECASKMSGKVTDPDAYCSALKDRVKGTTHWRGKGKD